MISRLALNNVKGIIIVNKICLVAFELFAMYYKILIGALKKKSGKKVVKMARAKTYNITHGKKTINIRMDNYDRLYLFCSIYNLLIMVHFVYG